MTTTNEPNESVEVSEAQIASHWREEEIIEPRPGFIAQANMADPSVLARFSMDNFPEYFREYADLLSWDKYWHTTLDTSNPPFWKWFAGGRLNVSYNCVDRHLAGGSEQGRLHMGRRARGRGGPRDHLPGTLRPG